MIARLPVAAILFLRILRLWTNRTPLMLDVCMSRRGECFLKERKINAAKNGANDAFPSHANAI
jgi:hypothetical protein